MQTQVEKIIEAARAEMSDNPHKVRTDKLFFAVATLVGRREALEDIQKRISAAAYDLQAVLLAPAFELPGHGHDEQPYSKAVTNTAVANFKASIREVIAETYALKVAKAAHVVDLRKWAEAA